MPLIILLFSFSSISISEGGLNFKVKAGDKATYRVDKYLPSNGTFSVGVNLGSWTDQTWENGSYVNVKLKVGDTFTYQICNITINSYNQQVVYSKVLYNGKSTTCYGVTGKIVVPVADNSTYYQNLANNSQVQLSGNKFTMIENATTNFNIRFSKVNSYDIKTGWFVEQYAESSYLNGSIINEIQISKISSSVPGFTFTPLIFMFFITSSSILLYRKKRKI